MADQPEPNASPEELSQDQTSVEDQNSKSAKKLVGFIAVMFMFGWASIPLYRIVCDYIDPGGTTYRDGSTQAYEGVEVDESRTIKVRFGAEVNRQLPWKFGPTEPSVEVHPGEKRLTKFYAENLDHSRELTGQGVYDIVPPEAAQYFKKIECFCFKEQTLDPAEKVDMPLYFWLDPEIPDHITQVTIAYTFFNAGTSRNRAQQGETAQR